MANVNMSKKLVDIGDESSGLDQIGERTAGSFQRFTQIFAYLLDLCSHISWADNFTRFVASELPGNENQLLTLRHDHMVIKHMAAECVLKQCLRLDLLRRHY